MDSVKWITSIELVTEAFRGPFQELDYRFQPAGESGIGSRLDVMPPHALFVSVGDGDTLPGGVTEITRIAWAGAGVGTVEVSVGAAGWESAEITASGPYRRVGWRAAVARGAGQAPAM